MKKEEFFDLDIDSYQNFLIDYKNSLFQNLESYLKLPEEDKTFFLKSYQSIFIYHELQAGVHESSESNITI